MPIGAGDDEIGIFGLGELYQLSRDVIFAGNRNGRANGYSMPREIFCDVLDMLAADASPSVSQNSVMVTDFAWRNRGSES